MSNKIQQPGSPRPGDVSPKLKIEAKKVFKEVEEGIAHERRTDKSDTWKTIDGLKDERGFFVKYVVGIFVQTVEKENVEEKFKAVKSQFEAYKDLGITIPETIRKHYETQDGGAVGGTYYIDDDEADILKKLVYEGEQKRAFQQQLEKRSGLNIEGNLGDIFENEPTQVDLMRYCDSFKKLLEKKGCFPDSVTSNPNPRVFEFNFGGAEGPQVVVINSKEDLKELQRWLNECTKVSGAPVNESKLNAADPFDVKEGAAKRQILMDLGRLSIDNLPVGSEPEGEKLKERNQMLIESIGLAFDEFVARGVEGNKNFDDAVLTKQTLDVQKKLKNGEFLTAEEAKKLQADTFMAMKAQRYLDDLRDNPIPTKIEGDLKAAFDGKMPEKAVFEKYLHELKKELIRGNYPGLITSDPDLHKFIFFIDGKYQEHIVSSLKDLENLDTYLKGCVQQAKKIQIDLGLYKTGTQANAEVAKLKEELAAVKEREAVAKEKQTTLVNVEQQREEEAKTKVSELQAALSDVRKEKEAAEKTAAAAVAKLKELEAKQKVADEAAKQVKAKDIKALTEFNAAWSAFKEKEAKLQADFLKEKQELDKIFENSKTLESDTKTKDKVVGDEGRPLLITEHNEQMDLLNSKFKKVTGRLGEISEEYDKLRKDWNQQVAVLKSSMSDELKKKVDTTMAQAETKKAEQALLNAKTALEGAKTDVKRIEAEKEAAVKLQQAQVRQLVAQATLNQKQVEGLQQTIASSADQLSNMTAAQEKLQSTYETNTEQLRKDNVELKSQIDGFVVTLKDELAKQSQGIAGQIVTQLESAFVIKQEAYVKELEGLKRDKALLEQRLKEQQALNQENVSARDKIVDENRDLTETLNEAENKNKELIALLENPQSRGLLQTFSDMADLF